MKICVVGAGRQGRVVAQDLAETGYQVTVLDIDQDNLSQVPGYKNISLEIFDIQEEKQFIEFLKGFDLAVGALPAGLGFYLMRCVCEARVDLVDLSYLPEDPFLLDDQARKNGVRIVPDAGFAPGLSNIVIGQVAQEFGGLDYLKVMVGGIPQEPLPPFNYRITWSLVDLIEEYTRPARIVKKGKLIEVEALTGIEEFELPGIGRFEAFYTDGLRTLLKTFNDTQQMEEKTIRYPGHARLFKALIDVGLFSDQQVRVEGRTINLKNFMIEFLKENLSKGDEKDLTILIIDLKKGKKARRIKCIDYYDSNRGITSMARLTAYTGSIIAQHIKKYPEFGVIPPEYLGRHRELWSAIQSELVNRGIRLIYE